ncbi:MAG: hypothetical protein C0603_12960 [Denitrovibrio sp.]|nr:MAG: hypothetical protein C0603_12960 [Denitrovibrio sp.]
MKGLYVHLPFCKNKCLYCGFYSETDSYDIQKEYFQALIADLKSREIKDYNTLYIGGGTPSSVDMNLLAGFLDMLSVLTKGNFAESTIEANPESISDDFLDLVHNYKFSRLSVGCQSTSDMVLKMLTRIHTSKDIFDSVELIRKKCPDTALNLDMIYDIPGAAFEDTFSTLKDLIKLNPEHISAYTYSFDTSYLEDKKDESTDFMIVRERLIDAGYNKYEISNFARSGHESLHNINYWQLGDYDGIGSSAWSLQNLPNKRILKGKTDNIRDYIKDPLVYLATETTDNPQTIIEELVFGLRITDGVDLDKICVNIDAELKDKLYNALTELKKKDLVVWNGSKVALSNSGELLLDSVQSFLWEQLP